MLNVFAMKMIHFVFSQDLEIIASQTPATKHGGRQSYHLANSFRQPEFISPDRPPASTNEGNEATSHAEFLLVDL
jgi:hypothetical protein